MNSGIMAWKQLLSHRRLGKNTAGELIRGRSPFQQDYDRIIFSSAFRRLQDKTQVFPLAESDYVRTRLTHSLEASCIGRSLGTLTGVHICQAHDVGVIEPSDIGAIVAAAALAHDIGNPPLGHSGEDAIREWFRHSPTAAALKSGFTAGQRADIERYEGNAQGFRVLARLQMPDNEGGMQLTCATLGAFVKYPVESTVKTRSDCFAKKFNFFQEDKALFAAVAADTGMRELSTTPTVWARHPLAFLVEAADGICYTIIDFEDGHSLGIIPYPDVEQAFMAIIGNEYCRERVAGMRENQRKVEFLRAMALNTLVGQLGESFVQHETEILRGELLQSLTDLIPAAAALKEIKDRSVNDVYTYRRAVEIEVAGYELATGLLDVFVGSVNDVAEHGTDGATGYHRKICRLLPEKFRPADDPDWRSDAYRRLLGILDFICGMTDSYAVNLYKKIKGISLPGQ